jgi:hypothetical protein
VTAVGELGCRYFWRGEREVLVELSCYTCRRSLSLVATMSRTEELTAPRYRTKLEE